MAKIKRHAPELHVDEARGADVVDEPHAYAAANEEQDPTNLFHVVKVEDPQHGVCVFVKSHNLLLTADDARSYAAWLNRVADSIR